jgi:hypothetical protein
VFVGLALLAFNPGHFHMPEFGGFAPNGIAPIFAALPAAGIVFSYLGFRQGVEFAGETKNPQKNVPFAVIGSIVLTGIIYILLQVAFIGAIPTDLLKDGWGGLSFSNSAGPWAEIAIMLGAMWLAIILYIDAVVSPADTGLIFTALTPRLSYSQARVGNAPSALTKLNKKRHPVVRSGGDVHRRLLPVLPVPVVGEDGRLHHLRHRHLLRVRPGHGGGSAPSAARPGAPVPLPGGDILPFLGFLAANLIVFWTGWDTNWKLFLAMVLGYVVLGLHYAFSDRSKIPPLQFKIRLVDDPVARRSGRAQPAEQLWRRCHGRAHVRMGRAGLHCIFTAIVFYVGIKTRLKSEEVVANVENTKETSAEHIDGE